jgi:dTDP-glucose 4,6-dehydratase
VPSTIRGPFLRTNIMGTETLLRLARKHAVGRFHHISTDEVFGALPLDDSRFNEDTPYAPRSPYAASKAASDHLVRAYGETHGLPSSITNSSNNYGPYHLPEKAIPLFITNALDGKMIPLYGDGRCVRDTLFGTNHCRAIDLVRTYCVGGGAERDGVQLPGPSSTSSSCPLPGSSSWPTGPGTTAATPSTPAASATNSAGSPAFFLQSLNSVLPEHGNLSRQILEAVGWPGSCRRRNSGLARWCGGR